MVNAANGGGGLLRRLLGIAAVLSVWMPSTAFAVSLAEVTECMRANIPGTFRVQSVQFVTVDRSRSQRLLSGRVVASREDDLIRANLRLESPPDLKGAAYLTRETRDGRDEMYLYLPALNRVRRVVGGTRNNPLFGTDFSYNDLRVIHSAFSGDQVTLLGTDTLESRPTHRLEVLRAEDDEEGPEKMQAWVDAESCVALRIDLLDGSDTLLKRIVSPAESLKQLPTGQWYAEQVVAEDVVAQSTTTLTIRGIEANLNVPERIFNPRSFYLGN